MLAPLDSTILFFLSTPNPISHRFPHRFFLPFPNRFPFAGRLLHPTTLCHQSSLLLF